MLLTWKSDVNGRDYDAQSGPCVIRSDVQGALHKENNDLKWTINARGGLWVILILWSPGVRPIWLIGCSIHGACGMSDHSRFFFQVQKVYFYCWA